MKIPQAIASTQGLVMANTHNLELFFLPASSMNSDHEVIPSACPSCVSALTSDPPRKLASSAPLASLEGDALISGFYSQPSVRVGPGLGGSHCLPPASGNLHILTVESRCTLESGRALF